MKNMKEKLDQIERLEMLVKWRGILAAVTVAAFSFLLIGGIFFSGSPKSYISAFKWYVTTGDSGWFLVATVIIGLFAGFAGFFLHLLAMRQGRRVSREK